MILTGVLYKNTIFDGVRHPLRSTHTTVERCQTDMTIFARITANDSKELKCATFEVLYIKHANVLVLHLAVLNLLASLTLAD